MEKRPAMLHHTASTRRTSIEQRPITPTGGNPGRSERSARRSLGEAGGLLLRASHGPRVGSAAAAIAETQPPLMPTGSRNRPSSLTGGVVLASSLTQPALPMQQQRRRQQQPQARSRRTASLNLSSIGDRSGDGQPQVGNHDSNRAGAASSSEQEPSGMLRRFRHRPSQQAPVAANSRSAGFRGDETGVGPEENAIVAAVEEGNRELVARVRELAALQRQLLVLQQGTATLQAAVSHARQGDDGDAAAAPVSRSRQGSGSGAAATAGDRVRAAGEESSAQAEDDDMMLHPVTCDGCGAGPPLAGRVMKCVQCEDYDLCGRCYADQDRGGHPRGHQFRQRTAGEDPNISRQLMLRVLESTMLREALRRSSEGDVDGEAAAQELAEVRAVETISTLPHVTWEQGATESKCSECALCLEEYTEGEEVLKLPCNHLFHEACIGPWFAKSLSCPLCQKEVST